MVSTLFPGCGRAPADRWRSVTLDGYTEAERVAIGLIAAEHAHEAGVRLERALAKTLRKATVQLDSGTPATVADVAEVLAIALEPARAADQAHAA